MYQASSAAGWPCVASPKSSSTSRPSGMRDVLVAQVAVDQRGAAGGERLGRAASRRPPARAPPRPRRRPPPRRTPPRPPRTASAGCPRRRARSRRSPGRRTRAGRAGSTGAARPRPRTPPTSRPRGRARTGSRSRVSGVESSSSSALTSRITTHHASPSGSAATTAGSTVAGIRANTPSANRSASRPGSRVQRPSQSEPGTIRFAISAVPSASTSLSMRLPDHPLEASVVRSATSPERGEQLLGGLRHGSAAGRGARAGRVDPVALDAPVGAEVQVVALAHRAAVVAHALEPHRDAAAGGRPRPTRSAGRGLGTPRPAPPRSRRVRAAVCARPRARRRARRPGRRAHPARRSRPPRRTPAAAPRPLGPAVPGLQRGQRVERLAAVVPARAASTARSGGGSPRASPVSPTAPIV